MIVVPAIANRAAVVAVADRSACAAVRVVTVSLLLARLGSVVSEFTTPVLVTSRSGRRVRQYQEHQVETCRMPEPTLRSWR